MTEGYKVQDVTADLVTMMKLTGAWEVDDEGYWHILRDDARYVHKIDNNDSGRQIVLFQDPMPRGDIHFFNPYGEGLGKKSEANTLFYTGIRTALNAHLCSVMEYVAREVHASKMATVEKSEYPLSLGVIRMSSVKFDKKSTLYDIIDETFLDELKTIRKRNGSDLVFVPYIPAQMTVKVSCPALMDTKWDELYGADIRKKSLLAFKALLMGVLGMKSPNDIEKFTVKYDPDAKTAARVWTTLNAYVRLYSAFNDVMAEAYGTDGVPNEHMEINLDDIQSVIDRSHLAYAIAKHMTQPSFAPAAATNTAPADTSKVRFDASNTGARRFSAISSDPAQPAPGSKFSLTPLEPTPRRFQPISAVVAVDPFAPAFAQAAPAPQQSMFMPMQNRQSMFANPPGMGGYAQGFDNTPPNGFGTPDLTKQYFG
jgi:hypothetical protein